MTDEKDNGPRNPPAVIDDNACNAIANNIDRSMFGVQKLTAHHNGLKSFAITQLTLRDQLITSLTRSIEALEQIEAGHKEEILSLQEKVHNLDVMNIDAEKLNEILKDRVDCLKERNTELESLCRGLKADLARVEKRLYSSFGWRLRKFFRRLKCRLKFWK